MNVISDDEDIEFMYMKARKNPANCHGHKKFMKAYLNRSYGISNKNVSISEVQEEYAEEEFVRRENHDQLHCDVPDVPRSTFLMVFSPDGTMVASTHGNHKIYVTDIRTGKNIKTLEGHPRTPWCIAFHPTCNQILASGCLGGQVRIWDLSGGSEVWTSNNQSVIASIAFHPSERILVIATFNEIYFWDWSMPSPFMHCDTGNVREKVRYVAFDRLGCKLITGISNSPQTRWDRVCAPVPVPHQVSASANPYRRRITPRLLTQESPGAAAMRERERRIILCYRNLVREYEHLVQRYLQIYRPPTMVDRGTDPMESNSLRSTHSGTQTAGASTSAAEQNTSTPSQVASSAEVNTSISAESNTSTKTDPSTATMNLNAMFSSLAAETSQNDSSQPSRSPGSQCLEASEPIPSTSRELPCISMSPGKSKLKANQQSTVIKGSQTNECRKHKASDKCESKGKRPNTSTVMDASTSSMDLNATSSSAASRNLLATETESLQSSRSFGFHCEEASEPVPSTSRVSQSLMTPSKIKLMLNKQATLMRGTQTNDCRKHKASDKCESKGKRPKINCPLSKSSNAQSTSSEQVASGSGETSSLFTPSRNDSPRASQDTATQTQHPAKVLVLRTSSDSPSTTSSINLSPQYESDLRSSATINSNNEEAAPSANQDSPERTLSNESRNTTGTRSINRGLYRLRSPDSLRQIASSLRRIASLRQIASSSVRPGSVRPAQFTANSSSHSSPTVASETAARDASVQVSGGDIRRGSSPGENVEAINELLSRIRRNAEQEVRTRMIPIFRSIPVSDRPRLMRLFENSREYVRRRFRSIPPNVQPLRRNRRPEVDTTSNSSSSDEDSSARFQETVLPATTATETQTTVASSEAGASSSRGQAGAGFGTNDSGNHPVDNSGAPVRNFNTELEQLVTSLLTELEGNDLRAPGGRGSEESTMSGAGDNNLSMPRETTLRASPRSSFVVTSQTSMVRELFNQTQPESLPVFTVYHSSSINVRPRYTNTTTRAINLETERQPNSPALVTPLAGASTDRLRREVSTASESQNGGNRFSSYISFPTMSTGTRLTTGSTVRSTDSVYASSAIRLTTTARRVSAFRPIRFRLTSYGGSRRIYSGSPDANSVEDLDQSDEPVNYSIRDSEGDVQQSRPLVPPEPRPGSSTSRFEAISSREDSVPSSPIDFNETPPPFPILNPEYIGIGNMYSNIVSDLESSLSDIRNLHASNRPGEISDMLSNFSERLENIMVQSNSILRNLRSAVDMLPNSSPARRRDLSAGDSSGFYIRDQRNDPTSEGFDGSLSHDPVASDHTYPRNTTASTENMSPIMSSLHFTISHIQRQARQLRRQVDSIERIDRAMLEVSQVQLIRQLIVELVRHMLRLSSENRSTGMSSVRQMMAGTRISDNSPGESPSEESNRLRETTRANVQSETGQGTAEGSPRTPAENDPTSETRNNRNNPMGNEPGPSTSGSTEGEGTSDGPSMATVQGRHRCSGRKTYPPSRLLRFHRQCRRTCVVQVVPRRYAGRADRAHRCCLPRSLFRSEYLRTQQQQQQRYNVPSLLTRLTRRLELVLTEQMRRLTSQQDPWQAPRSYVSYQLEGEQMIVLRLHGSLLRMSRILNTESIAIALRNFHSESAQVGPEGASRYDSRITLSSVIDELSRELENISSNNLTMSDRMQIHAALTMSLLLSELLLLQIVDSIPPPSGMNLDPERESLTTRIDQMCDEMLRSRFSGYSAQLTTSLRLMRLTMRTAYRTLGQTYHSRRNAMLSDRHSANRRELYGSIDRCLRAIQRERLNIRTSEASSSDQPSTSAPNILTSPINNDPAFREYFNTLQELLNRYSDNNTAGPSSSRSSESRPNNPNASMNNDPSTANSDNEDDDDDDDDDETEFMWNRRATQPTTTSHSSTTDQRNSTTARETAPSVSQNNPSVSSENVQSRSPLPLVQVIPAPGEPDDEDDAALLNQLNNPQNRFFTQRDRFVDRISELRSNPSFGFYRPRFLHPFYESPFDHEHYDPYREHVNDSDALICPNHRIQVWDMTKDLMPMINDATINLVVGDCKIHNDASVDISKDGTILVTLLPANGYVNINISNRLGVYSLCWESLGQCLYTTDFYQNAVSVALSPLSRHLVVGLASRRIPILPNERWTMARIFRIEKFSNPENPIHKLSKDSNSSPMKLSYLRELEQTRDGRALLHRSINCIRWLPVSGQGLIYATNTGQLVILN